MDNRLVNFVLISGDEYDVMSLHQAFKEYHILNPLITEHLEEGALDLFRKENIFPCIILFDITGPENKTLHLFKKLGKILDPKSASFFLIVPFENFKYKIPAGVPAIAGQITKPLTFEKMLSAVSSLDKAWQLREKS